MFWNVALSWSLVGLWNRLMGCWRMCRAQYDFVWAQLWYPSIAGLATCTGVSDLVIPWREGQACAP